MTPEERQKRMQERLAAMTPEERQAFQERMANRRNGFGAGGGGGQGFTPGGGRGMGPGGNGAPRGNANANANPSANPNAGRGGDRRGIAARVEAGAAVKSGAENIDALFAPIVVPEIPGRVWLYVDKQLKPVRVRTALADGTFSEVVEGDLKEGQEVVVNMVTGLEPKTTPGQQGTGNPLMGPQRGGPGGPGGNRGGGGGGRGF
jgi:hypothetical protein